MSEGDDAESPTLARTNERLKKQIIDETEALRRRIAKLRVDEFRTHSNIQSLERRTQQAEQRKKQYERDVSARQQREESIRKSRAATQDHVVSAREESKRRIEEAKQRCLAEKRDAVDELRRMRLIHECEINVRKESDRERVITSHDTVRETDKGVKRKQMRESARKIQGIRDAQRRDMERDQQERDEKLREIRKLEREEAALRDRIDQAKSLRAARSNDLAAAESRPVTSQSPRSSRRAQGSNDSLPPI